VAGTSPALTRYADDLVACCTPGNRPEQVKARLAAWVAPRGLAFNEAKTRIVRLDGEGFEFLGFHLRRYPNGKLLIKTSVTAIKRFRKRLAKEFRALRGANVGGPGEDHPITRGWVAYYRTVVSTRVFHILTDYLWKLTYKWRAGGTRTSRNAGSSSGIYGRFEKFEERSVGVW